MSQRAHRRTGALAAAALAVATGATVPAPSLGHPANDHTAHMQTDDLQSARAATRKFRDVEVARAAGYVAAAECVQDRKYGGMGSTTAIGGSSPTAGRT